jgi:TnpA family transposase
MLAQTISVARAVLFNRLGELLTRMRPQLGVAAIVTWNTLYLEHAVEAFAGRRTKKISRIGDR